MIIIKKHTKENIQFISSLIMLICGVVLVFISLFLPPAGVIHPSVISVFGLFLTFVGAVWNIDVKYAFKTEELRNDYRHRYKEDIEDETEEEVG